MPKILPLNLVTQKNLLHQGDPWIILLHIHLKKLSDPTTVSDYYLCRNYKDVTYNSQLYTAFPFILDASRTNAKGRIENVTLKLSNIARTLQPTLESYDGGVDSTVKLIVVNNALLDEDHSALEIDFSILNVTSNAKFVVLILGAANPLRQRHPLYKYYFAHCRYVSHYKGAECRAVSSLATCDGTLNNCIERKNTKNFGGFPGIKAGGLQIASR